MAGVVVLNVVAGGMRSITLVQAFQYWLKLTAIAVPVVFLLLAWHADGAPDPAAAAPPVARSTTTVRVPDAVRVRVDSPVDVTVRGTLDGRRVDGAVRLPAGTAELAAGTEVTLPAGAVVPHVVDVQAAGGTQWAMPTSGAGGRDHPLYRVYSLLVALLFGTMGLPHVLVRFYTNPDGRAARRTTLVVLALLGLFYVFPAVYGAMGRLYAPDLLLTGRTDAVVLLLPGRMLAAPWSGLARRWSSRGPSRPSCRRAAASPCRSPACSARTSCGGGCGPASAASGSGALLAVGVPVLLSLLTLRTSLADMVGLAFAVAASSFCPLLVLGIWWRGLTPPARWPGWSPAAGSPRRRSLGTIAGGGPRGGAGAAGPARGLVDAGRVRRDGGRVAAHAPVGARRRRRGRWSACTRPRRWDWRRHSLRDGRRGQVDAPPVPVSAQMSPTAHRAGTTVRRSR